MIDFDRLWGVIVVFTGEYNHTIDSKNRIIVPIKLREGLGETFFVSKGFDGCLYLSTNEDWQSFCLKLKELPSNAETRDFIRKLSSSSMECEPDKQGRIIIPQKLKEFAKLDKDVVLVGAINRVEIWSKEVYDGISDNESLDSVMEKLSEKYGLQF